MTRYLTLSPEQLLASPASSPSPLLTEQEADALHYSLVRPGAPLPDHLAPLRNIMSQVIGEGRSREHENNLPVIHSTI